MYKIPDHIRRSIDTYKPIQVDGLTLHPIEVQEYAAFQVAVPAISFMQQSLPVALLRVPLLDAYYKLELAAYEENKESDGLLFRAALFLALALGLRKDAKPEMRASAFDIVADAADPTRLKCLRTVLHGEEIVEITPAQFQTLRVILAAQNGIELQPDTANPELVRAEQEMALLNAPQLDIRLQDKIGFIAALCRVEESDIARWPILKLDRRERALTHVLRYMLCGVSEAQGGSWKHGNPYPHPYYDRNDNTGGALKNISDVVPKEAQNAINNPGEKTTQ